MSENYFNKVATDKEKEAVRELIEASKNHDKLAWEDILKPRNNGKLAHHIFSISEIMVNKHNGTPKVFTMSDEEVVILCHKLLKHLWFSGGLYDLYVEEDLKPRINKQLADLNRNGNEKIKLKDLYKNGKELNMKSQINVWDNIKDMSVEEFYTIGQNTRSVGNATYHRIKDKLIEDGYIVIKERFYV